MGTVYVAPALLSADFTRLHEVCDAVAVSADMIHLDIMDGHFGPSLTMGPHIVSAIRKLTSLPLDVHLMVENPARFLEVFRAAGANRLAIHWEASQDPLADLTRIHQLGAQAGIAINLDTPVSVLRGVLEIVDYVVILSVDLWDSDHRFNPSALEKIRKMVAMKGNRVSPQIEIDGGVTVETAGLAKLAGAEVLVAGGAVFQAESPEIGIRCVREA